MERAAFLATLDADGRRMLDLGARDLGAAVPTCPGWAVRDALAHTAEVYDHKVECIRLAGAGWPRWDPQPPDDVLAAFAASHARVVDVLTSTDPAAPSVTFWEPDQTAGFWLRRMAQETAVHRVDVESAFGEVTPVDRDLAVDGVDELLVQILGGVWADEPLPEVGGTVDVTTGGRSWHVAPDGGVTEGAPGADATVTGEPSDVLLWLWGRAPEAAVSIAGDPDVVKRLRERIVLATQ